MNSEAAAAGEGAASLEEEESEDGSQGEMLPETTTAPAPTVALELPNVAPTAGPKSMKDLQAARTFVASFQSTPDICEFELNSSS